MSGHTRPPVHPAYVTPSKRTGPALQPGAALPGRVGVERWSWSWSCDGASHRLRDDSGSSCRPLCGKQQPCGLAAWCVCVCLSAHLCRLSASTGTGNSLRTGRLEQAGQPRFPGPHQAGGGTGRPRNPWPRGRTSCPASVRVWGPKDGRQLSERLLRNGGCRGECQGCGGTLGACAVPAPTDARRLQAPGSCGSGEEVADGGRGGHCSLGID